MKIDDYHIVGLVDLDKGFLNEDKVGNINLKSILGLCGVYVRSKEGNIPHFHLVFRDFPDSCICIYTNQYFTHGQYITTLDSRQKKNLDKWLDEDLIKGPNIDKRFTGRSNWEYIVFLWEDLNPECLFPADKKVAIKPDYTTMKTTINPNIVK